MKTAGILIIAAVILIVTLAIYSEPMQDGDTGLFGWSEGE